MKVYISGIVRSMDPSETWHEQEYRDRIGGRAQGTVQEVTISSPESIHINNDRDEKSEESLFFKQIQNALMADLVIAYLPMASMGSAIEIWEAYKNSRPVIIISPLESNWTVRFLSARVFPDLDSFLLYVKDGGLDGSLLDRYSTASG